MLHFHTHTHTLTHTHTHIHRDGERQHFQGSIFTILWRKAQMQWNIGFGIVGAIHFHQQNWAQLYQFTQLEVMLNI